MLPLVFLCRSIVLRTSYSFPHIHVVGDDDTSARLITTCPLSHQHVIDSVGLILSARFSMVAMTIRRATILTLVCTMGFTFHVSALVQLVIDPNVNRGVSLMP